MSGGSFDDPRFTQGMGALTADALNGLMRAASDVRAREAEEPRAGHVPGELLGTYVGRVTSRITLTANRFRYVVEPVVLTSGGVVSGVAAYGFTTADVYSVTEVGNTAGAIRNPPLDLDNLPDGFTVTYPDVDDLMEVTIRRDDTGNPIHTTSTWFGVDGECTEPSP